MSLKIKVYSDYVCPFCFLAKFPFEEAIKDKDVEVEWLPFELRPEPQPKLDPINDPDKLAAWESYISPTIKRLNIDMKLPNVSPHPYTGLAFEGYHFANEHGKGKEYNDRIFKAFFQEDKNIGEISILVGLAKDVGLDAVMFEKALIDRTYKDVQSKALLHAYNEAGVNVVPTFIIGNTVLSGMNSKETFEKAVNNELKDIIEKEELL
jgi:predicted DsbA family dithiol-disulfide isomerase